MEFKHSSLPTGLEIYAVEDHSAPIVAVQVWYHVGSKDDPPGRSGFAHLFEHMMFNDKNFASERDVVKEEYRQRIRANSYGEFYLNIRLCRAVIVCSLCF